MLCEVLCIVVLGVAVVVSVGMIGQTARAAGNVLQPFDPGKTRFRENAFRG